MTNRPVIVPKRSYTPLQNEWKIQKNAQKINFLELKSDLKVQGNVFFHKETLASSILT